jgi:hypothetical protein
MSPSRRQGQRFEDNEGNEDEGPSAEQIAWVEVADELRERLRRRLEFVPTSASADNYQLVLSLQSAYWFSINCRAYDEHLSAETDKKPWADDD